jgi:hypothetical protein
MMAFGTEYALMIFGMGIVYLCSPLVATHFFKPSTIAAMASGLAGFYPGRDFKCTAGTFAADIRYRCLISTLVARSCLRPCPRLG